MRDFAKVVSNLTLNALIFSAEMTTNQLERQVVNHQFSYNWGAQVLVQTYT